MVAPLPPSVSGPLTRSSKIVHVSGVLPTAKVIIFVDGQKSFVGDLPIDNWIEIGTELKPGQEVTAAQDYMGEESEQSLTPIRVADDPTSLPVPEFALPPNNFSSLVSIGKLEIGSVVTIKRADNGTVVGEDKAQRQQQFFKLDQAVSIASAENLTVSQSFNTTSSGEGMSPKLLRIDDVTKILPPLQLFPNELVACSTSVSFANAVPGLEVRVENEGKVTTFLSGEQAYTVDDCQPLSLGKLIATHSIPRVDVVSEPAVAEVSKLPEMLPPLIAAPYCPSLGKLSVATMPGAVIHVVAQAGAGGEWTEIGVVYASKQVDSYDLAASRLPQGATAIAAFADFCGAISPQSPAVGIGGVEPSPQAAIQEPLYQCTQYIKLTGLARGTLVHIEDKEGTELLAGQVALGDWMVAKLEHALDVEQHRVVIVTLTHCSGSQQLAAEVKKLPDRHQPVILPIHPGDGMMRVKGALQGSRVDVYRNDVFVASGVTFGDPALFWLGGIAQERESYSAIESLCSGRWEMHGTPVTRAQLKVETPPQVRAGMVQTLTLHARDAETGEEVTTPNLRAKLDTSPDDFAITEEIILNLPADRTAPLRGSVFGLPRYDTANFSIPVVPNAPPPATSKKLRIEIGPQNFSSVLAAGMDGNIYNVLIDGTLGVNSVKVIVTPINQAAKTLDMTLGANQVFSAETDMGTYEGGITLEFDFVVSYDFNIDQTWGFLASNEKQNVKIYRNDTPQGIAYAPLQFTWPDTHDALHFMVSPVAQPKKPGATDNKVVIDVTFHPEF